VPKETLVQSLTPSFLKSDDTTNTETPGPRPTPEERLAGHIARVRRFINVHVRLGQDMVAEKMDRYFELEHSVTDTIANLAPPKDSPEKILPGLLYVGVAGMAGALLVRRRNILLRGLTPLAFATGAAWAFIPETTRNTGDLLWRFEQKVPAVADTHLAVRKGIEDGLDWVETGAENAKKSVDQSVSKGKKAVEDLVRKG
jgi:MICOS complex subunit MIC26